jgi:two-component system CheB/CheR fusion protein
MFNVKCSFKAGAPVSIADPAAATNLYRIAQEAVGNAVKHGKAGAIEISLDNTNNTILLAVRDDGVGFMPQDQTGSGMGLRIMQYRAGMIGATLLVQSQVKAGTRVLCFLQNSASQPAK